MTPAQIKAAYEARNNGDRFFFDRKTMKWFGDRMSSYGTRAIDGVTFMYRKPGAMVNVFGNWKRAGRDFFNAWRWNPDTADLDHCDAETTQRVWDRVA